MRLWKAVTLTGGMHGADGERQRRRDHFPGWIGADPGEPHRHGAVDIDVVRRIHRVEHHLEPVYADRFTAVDHDVQRDQRPRRELLRDEQRFRDGDGELHAADGDGERQREHRAGRIGTNSSEPDRHGALDVDVVRQRHRIEHHLEPLYADRFPVVDDDVQRHQRSRCELLWHEQRFGDRQRLRLADGHGYRQHDHRAGRFGDHPGGIDRPLPLVLDVVRRSHRVEHCLQSL